MATLGKTHSTQLLARLSYLGDGFFGVTPQQEGMCVQDAVFARLERAKVFAEPYAVSFAARTDRGVDACDNWLSFRVRLPQTPEDPRGQGALADLVAALQTPPERCDGLGPLQVLVAHKRLMARNLAQAKHYCYALPVIHSEGPTQLQEYRTLQQAAKALSGTVHVGRLAHRKALAHTPQWLHHDVWVEIEIPPSQKPGCGQAAAWRVHVVGRGFLRYQVRYIAAALLAVQKSSWRTEDVAFIAQGLIGPCKEGLRSPLPAAGLTLMALWPTASAAPLLKRLRLAPHARFYRWLSAAAAIHKP